MTGFIHPFDIILLLLKMWNTHEWLYSLFVVISQVHVLNVKRIKFWYINTNLSIRWNMKRPKRPVTWITKMNQFLKKPCRCMYCYTSQLLVLCMTTSHLQQSRYHASRVQNSSQIIEQRCFPSFRLIYCTMYMYIM